MTDYVNVLPLSVTVTLQAGMQVLRMTHRLIIYSDYLCHIFLISFDRKIIDWTQNIHYNTMLIFELQV
jgi:hypothetical protein